MQFPGWINTEIARTIGWSMVHSLWQSLAILAILKLLLQTIPIKNSDTRYIISLSALGSMIACSIITFVMAYGSIAGTAMPVIADSMYSPATGLPASQSVTGSGNTVPVYLVSTLSGFITAISPYLSFAWIAGMIFCMARITVGSVQLKTLRKLPVIYYPAAIKRMNELSARMGISKNIRLIINEKITEPLTFGFFKPVVLLPFSYVSHIPMQQLEMILAHELAHIKRNDYLVNLLQSLLEAVYFFNPFFQSISRITRDEREYCCDDKAAAICGNKNEMAIALTNLKFLTMYPKLSLPATPAKASFHQRIYRLINPAQMTGFSLKNTFFSLLAITAIIGVLTKCSTTATDMERAALPQQTDKFRQLLTDNQGGSKIDVLAYERGDQKHEIFLVSSIEGKPQYAYLDGAKLQPKELDHVHKLIKQERVVYKVMEERVLSKEEKTELGKSAVEAHRQELALLNGRWNEISQKIAVTQIKPASASTKQELIRLKEVSDFVAEKIKKLTMDEYEVQIKDIPIVTELHSLLTRIVTTKQYTTEDRIKLNELIRERGNIVADKFRK